jgi:hypothetical protein
MPHARVVHALADVALDQLRQVQAGAEVLALAVSTAARTSAGQVAERACAVAAISASLSALRLAGRFSAVCDPRRRGF